MNLLPTLFSGIINEVFGLPGMQEFRNDVTEDGHVKAKSYLYQLK